MAVIRREVIDQWRQSNQDSFVEAILQQVRASHPTWRQTDDMLRSSVRVGIDRARANGLSSDRHISEFVLIMCEIAPNFDQQPEIRNALDDTSLPPAERWESLFQPRFDAAWEAADDPAFYDADAWFDHPVKEVSQCELPSEEEMAEFVAAWKILQATPPGQPAREPSPEEVASALADLRKRVGTKSL